MMRGQGFAALAAPANLFDREPDIIKIDPTQYLISKIPPPKPDQILDQIRIKALAKLPGRDARDDGVRGHVSSDYGAGSYNSAVSNAYAGHDNNVIPDPYVIADCRGWGEIELRWADKTSSDIACWSVRGKTAQAVLSGADGHSATDRAVTADGRIVSDHRVVGVRPKSDPNGAEYLAPA